ncbi:hypothetical protein TWF481_011666 [Arthrobotrys musiformis]|uniref:Secreted protein n=1 Tax=Arthrobotrys musiformis TaxID=47236 RepID=A0AAV9W0C8_9PEZI
MSTAVLAAAALFVLYNGSEMALKTCISASETSTSATEPSEEMETLSHDPNSTVVRMQRRVSSIGLIGCLFPTRSNASSTRSFGSFRRMRRQGKSTAVEENAKPKYVHTPQHAADSHARTTTPLPLSMRHLSQDVASRPIKAPGPLHVGVRPMSSEVTIQPTTLNSHLVEQEYARNIASQGGRVHIVGSLAS